MKKVKKVMIVLSVVLLATYAQASVAIGTATTSATGSTFVPLATSGPADKVDIMNNTGTALEVRLGGSGATFQIATGVGYTLTGIKTLSQVEVRRADSSGTQVTFSYVYSGKD